MDNKSLKKISAAAGAVLILAGGGLLFTHTPMGAKGEKAPKAAADTVDGISTDGEEQMRLAEIGLAAEAAVNVSREISLPISLPEKNSFSFIELRKAPIGEYDSSLLEVRAKSAEGQGEEIAEPEEFTVPMPEQDTLIYLPERRAPLNLTDTRSVADEYYRVYDENSKAYYVMNAHELLCLMVNNEIGDSWNDEAIKAQIVAAYCHLRYNHEHGLTPTIGLRYGYSARLEGLVSSVEGQAMHYNGSVINGVYSASTAGYSTTSKDIWNVEYPYLKCVESEYDSLAPNYGVVKTYSKAEVKAKLEDKLGIKLSDDVSRWFTVTRAYSVAYIDKLMIDGREDCTLTGIQLCNMMGLMSNAIEIRYKDGQFIFTSYGWGHGVGMSQWGAKFYADNGWTYDQILTHYYVDAYLALSSPCESAHIAQPEITDNSESSKAEDSSAPDESSETAAEEVTENTDDSSAAEKGSERENN